MTSLSALTFQRTRFEEIKGLLQGGFLTATSAKQLLANPSIPVASLKLPVAHVTNYQLASPQKNTSAGPTKPAPNYYLAEAVADIPYAFTLSHYRNYTSPVDYGVPGGAVPEFVFPVTPEEVQIGLANSATSITTISGRTFTHAAALDLEKITFTAFLPHVASSELSSLLTPGHDPNTMGQPGVIADKLRRTMRANQPFIFAVHKVREDGLGGSVVVTPMEMTITSLQRTIKAGHGSDIFYDIELQRWYPQDGHVTPGPRKYTTVTGDSLATIARDQLKKTSRVGEIRKMNKDKLPILYRPLAPGDKSPTNYTKVLPGVVLSLPRK